jgi:uncharacterized protein YbaR (Trm112 family)
MHIALTDHLSCPVCGPEHGLILLADRIEERRVLEGTLGCPACRERYPIVGGLADLRPRPAGPLPGPESAPAVGPHDRAFRLAALMGVAEGPGFLLVAGDAAALAPGVVGVVEGIEVVAVDAALAGWPEEAGVSRVAAGDRLPVRSGSMQAVAVTGGVAAGWLEEGARVLSPFGRLVIEPAPGDAEERLRAAGLLVLAREGGTIVAARG